MIKRLNCLLTNRVRHSREPAQVEVLALDQFSSPEGVELEYNLISGAGALSPWAGGIEP